MRAALGFDHIISFTGQQYNYSAIGHLALTSITSEFYNFFKFFDFFKQYIKKLNTTIVYTNIRE